MEEKIEIIVQYGITPDEGKLYEVERSFYLPVVDGPAQVVYKGDHVLLSPKFGDEMFYCHKVSPVNLSDTFEVLVPLQFEEAGQWIRTDQGDEIRLNREEAILLLRQKKFEKKGGKHGA